MHKPTKYSPPKNYAINPFDTPLGCRKPLSNDREFLINILTQLVTPAGGTTPERIPELCGLLVEEMYSYFSDDGTPNIYEEGVDVSIDDAIMEHSIHISDETSWWNIVDMFFAKSQFNTATQAQRYAMPTLNDATTVLSSNSSLGDMFGKERVSFIQGMLVSASREYPNIATSSRFSIGSARIISLDLMDVAKAGSASAEKRTGIMYLLARSCAKEFFRNKNSLSEMPEKYRSYHSKIIEQNAMVPKRICMDEFHRTKGIEGVRRQAVEDIREGRKFNVQVCLLSQELSDFDDSAVKNATNVYILSKGMTEDVTREIIDRFSPSKDAIAALKKDVTGPSAEGSTLLYLGGIKKGQRGRVEHTLRLSLGAGELWAYTTTAEEVYLRNMLASKIGIQNTLRILSKELPTGGKDYIEDKMTTHSEGGNIYELIASELISKNRKLII